MEVTFKAEYIISQINKIVKTHISPLTIMEKRDFIDTYPNEHRNTFNEILPNIICQIRWPRSFFRFDFFVENLIQLTEGDYKQSELIFEKIFLSDRSKCKNFYINQYNYIIGNDQGYVLYKESPSSQFSYNEILLLKVNENEIPIFPRISDITLDISKYWFKDSNKLRSLFLKNISGDQIIIQ